MPSSELLPSAYGAYRDLLAALFRPGSPFDRLDDLLIGFPTPPAPLPPSPGPHNDHLVRALVGLPPAAEPALQGPLVHRPYSLLTLFALHGDRVLLYALLSRDVSVKDFDWSRANHLSSEARTVLCAARRAQKARRTIQIPPDVKHALKEATDTPPQPAQADTSQRDQADTHQPASPTPAQRPKRGRSPSRPARKRRQQRPGIVVDGFFVEDYDEDYSDQEEDDDRDRVEDVPRPQAGPAGMNAARPLTAAQQNKRARLALLSSALDPAPQRAPAPPAPVERAAGRVPKGPPYRVRLTNIPKEASRDSIEVFLQVGAEAFKLARSLNHRIDALGRSVNKYRPGFRGFQNTIQAKFPNLLIHQSNLIINNSITKNHLLVQIVEIGKIESLKLAEEVIREFHGKPYLVHDKLSPRISAQFIDDDDGQEINQSL